MPYDKLFANLLTRSVLRNTKLSLSCTLLGSSGLTKNRTSYFFVGTEYIMPDQVGRDIWLKSGKRRVA